MKKICVLGLGYIGLPTAAMFATHGFQVVGVDVNAQVVETLNNGEVHIHEPGLKTLVQAALKSGNLRVVCQPEPADAFIIAVPTPITADKRADLRYVEAAARAIVPHLRSGNLVILESTVPPGTTRGVLAPILGESGLHPQGDLLTAHSPERVLPGRILAELVGNDRVIGGLTPEAAEAARALYASFVQGEIHLTDTTTAEMVKLMENTYRDVNIALANEFALVAEAVGVNVWQAIKIANRHPRVNILKPGPGVGGHCIAVDPWFLVQAAPGPAQLIAAARRLNDRMPQHVADQVRTILTGVEKPQIAALGLAYKADVDDARESPAIAVIRWLQATGCQVRAYDPRVKNGHTVGEVDSITAAAEGADCLLILTDHREFKVLTPATVGDMMRRKVLIDTRNALPHADWQATGFEVHILGNGRLLSASPDGSPVNKSAETILG
jgi:UDP-N-acetyl-D-mannosaminuronic acid dehydrogenase